MDNNKEYKFGEYKEKHNGPPGGPMGAPVKVNDFAGTWKKLINYCKDYIAVFIVAIICASVGTVLTLIGPDKLSEMTDVITAGLIPDTASMKAPTIDMESIIQIGFTLVFFYAASFILSAIQGIIVATVTQRISKRMRSDISKKSIDCPCGITTGLPQVMCFPG